MIYLHKHKVGYAETDQMGFMHHSNYARIFENARWELFRSLGLPYKQIENEGILMPVVDMELKFRKPAFYDDELTVNTTIKKRTGVRIFFEYTVTNSKQETINIGKTTLAFMDKHTRKPVRVPEIIAQIIN